MAKKTPSKLDSQPLYLWAN